MDGVREGRREGGSKGGKEMREVDWECGQREGRREWSVETAENLVYIFLSLSVQYIDVNIIFLF